MENQLNRQSPNAFAQRFPFGTKLRININLNRILITILSSRLLGIIKDCPIFFERISTNIILEKLKTHK